MSNDKKYMSAIQFYIYKFGSNCRIINDLDAINFARDYARHLTPFIQQEIREGAYIVHGTETNEAWYDDGRTSIAFKEFKPEDIV